MERTSTTTPPSVVFEGAKRKEKRRTDALALRLTPFPQLQMLFELLEQQLLPRFSIESIAEALGVVLHETLGFRFLFLLGILVVAAIVVAGRVRRPQRQVIS